jgi:hypothetical protein
MENLNSIINWKERERDLQISLGDLFRKTNISYSRFNTLCITAFPNNVNETYIVLIEKNVEDWSVENLKNIVLSQLKNRIPTAV